MKIAIAINTSWNIFNFRLGLIRNFLTNGHEVLTIAPKDEFTEELTNLGCVHREVNLQNSGLNPISDILYLNSLKRIFKEERPDVVLSYTIKPNIYSAIACNDLKIPVISNVSGLGTTFLWNNILKSFIKKLYNYSFRKSTFIFFQNPDDRELFLREMGVPEEKTSILPGSGIDTSVFLPFSKKSNSGHFKFLMISRLLIDKGVYEYCQAAEEIKSKGLNVEFQLLGQKDPTHKRSIDLEKFEKWVESGVINYLGTSKDVNPIIAEADCVVLPSYREGTPRTLLEAASMGKPLVATDVPGCNNVVKHDYNGLLCEVKDANSLASTMSALYSLSESTLEKMGRNSRELVEKQFDVKFVIQKYNKKIEAVTGETVAKKQQTTRLVGVQ